MSVAFDVCRMDLVQVPGKRTRMVSILTTPDVRNAMDILCDTRAQCGIPSTNKYFFTTDLESGYLNGWLVLHNAAVAADVDKPHLFTSTRLRKYVATLAQASAITDVCRKKLRKLQFVLEVRWGQQQRPGD